ncbi:hypothetical protein TWF694_008138 [Orbilia ellipsospora]|uniref:WSC domain-containing protein n=1 Tax=Orbilia ellipsospora TaxID=2528407 RepID=A0AAV9XGL3_9PEZI
MRVISFIAASAIAFTTTVLAIPADVIPRNSFSLEKRTYPPTWYFPPYNGTFTPWKPVGCYAGESPLTYNTGMCSCQNAAWTPAAGAMPFSMEKCFAYCKSAGFRYAGIKGNSAAKSCWCGNGISDDDKLSTTSKCDVPCGDGEGGKDYDINQCGGATTYTIYKDPCYKDYDADTEITKYEYVGCFWYYDGTILGYWIGTVSDNLSVDSCIEHCAGKGFAYAGMAASGGTPPSGNQCWCGGKIAQAQIDRHKAYPADNNQCTTLCSASAKVQWSISKDDYQYCGGPWYMSIYFNANLAESETCEAGPPKVTITQTTPGPTPGTSTIPGTSTDTVVITVSQEKTTVTVTTPGPTDGTTTKTGEKTDSVIITTPAEHDTTTITTPGDKPGTTTKTGPSTDTVIITTPAEHETVTVTTPGPSDGTTTKTGSKTDTVIITTPTEGPSDTPDHATVTITTPGPTDGTTTKTGSKTDTVIITTPTEGPSDTPDHATVTVTTPGPSDGTTTKTGSKTDTVIITTPTEGPSDTPDHATVTVTTPGPSDGTTTKTGSKTDTVIITTPTEGPSDTPDHATVTVTTPGPSDGTTTKTGSKTDTVIITTPTEGPSDTPDHPTVTVTTPGSTPGTTTKTGPSTDTVIITTPTGGPSHATVTVTTPGPSDGTTTKTGPSTDTVIITTPTEGPSPTDTPETPTGKVTITITTPGPKSGTTTIPGSKTDTVIITTPGGPSPQSEHPTTTITTPGSTPGTTTKTGPSTDTVVVTTPTGSPSSTQPATPMETPGNTCCLMAQPSRNDLKNGIKYPLWGIGTSPVTSTDQKSITLTRLTGINTNCRTSYKWTIEEFQAACWNGCMEQQKKCTLVYAKQKVCTGNGRNKRCFSSSDLRRQCDDQYSACKSANDKKKSAFKDAMSKCGKPQEQDPEDDGGYYRKW